MTIGLIEPTTRMSNASRYVGRRVSQDEDLIRGAVDAWGRARWPGARVCHELVVGRGQNRADLAFIQLDHFVTVEIKSQFDNVERLIAQVAAFRLASPETWVIVDPSHKRDAELVRYLLPSVGVALVPRASFNETEPREVKVIAEPAPFRAEPEAMLSLLWVAELHAEAVACRVWSAKPGTHAAMVKRLIQLPEAEQVAAVCRQLRRRDAVWRADPPIVDRVD